MIHPIKSVSVSVVKEFLEVNPDDLPRVHPKREIYFNIHIIPDICPIFSFIQNGTSRVESS